MRILVINGPNLNLLGTREPEIYGATTLADIEQAMRSAADRYQATLHFMQSNHEGVIIDTIQEHQADIDGIIINPGAFTHYSYAIRDALSNVRVPIIEVHISNVYKREAFRHHSVIAPVATGQIAGLGWRGYLSALEWLCQGQ
jgi:3-dehydroquinate dehydratase-2